MRTLSIALLLTISLGAAAAAPPVPQYDSEEKAKTHCPLDTIVWVNPRTHLWYPQNSKHYANDGVGGFACLADAKAGGMKEGKG